MFSRQFKGDAVHKVNISLCRRFLKHAFIFRNSLLQTLTLTELEATASLRTTRFLTLNGTCVTSKESVIFQILLVFLVDFNECACNGEAQSLALTCETATIEVHLYIIFLSYVKKLQRLLNNILQDS